MYKLLKNKLPPHKPVIFRAIQFLIDKMSMTVEMFVHIIAFAGHASNKLIWFKTMPKFIFQTYWFFN